MDAYAAEIEFISLALTLERKTLHIAHCSANQSLVNAFQLLGAETR